MKMKKMKKVLLGLLMVTMASQMMLPAAFAAETQLAESDYRISSPAGVEAESYPIEEYDTDTGAQAASIGQLNEQTEPSQDTALMTRASSTGKIIASVNLRSKPSTSGSVIRLIKKGETVTILGQPNSRWYKVKDSKGNTGYVSASSKYIKVSGSTGSSTGSSTGGSNSSGAGSTGGSVSSNSASSKIEKVIEVGYSYLGTPYEYGSDRNSTKTFDCSDFVRRAYIQGAGITLPSDSRKQAAYIKNNSTVKKSISSLKRGDLMFFGKHRGSSKSDYKNVNKDTETVTHVAIYLGDGKILHTYSEKSGGVRVDTITGKSWEYRFLYGGSVL